MTFSFQIKDDNGEILSQGTEKVNQKFSMYEFLAKTIPGWEKTIKIFYDQKGGVYSPYFRQEGPYGGGHYDQAGGPYTPTQEELAGGNS